MWDILDMSDINRTCCMSQVEGVCVAETSIWSLLLNCSSWDTSCDMLRFLIFNRLWCMGLGPRRRARFFEFCAEKWFLCHFQSKKWQMFKSGRKNLKNFTVGPIGPKFFQTFEKLSTAGNFFKKQHKVISFQLTPDADPPRRAPARCPRRDVGDPWQEG